MVENARQGNEACFQFAVKQLCTQLAAEQTQMNPSQIKPLDDLNQLLYIDHNLTNECLRLLHDIDVNSDRDCMYIPTED